MKTVLKIGHQEWLFLNQKDAVQAMTAISKAFPVSSGHVLSKGYYTRMFWPDQSIPSLEMTVVQDNQLIDSEPKKGAEGDLSPQPRPMRFLKSPTKLLARSVE